MVIDKPSQRIGESYMRIVVHLDTMKPKIAGLKIGYLRVQSGYKQIASLKHS